MITQVYNVDLWGRSSEAGVRSQSDGAERWGRVSGMNNEAELWGLIIGLDEAEGMGLRGPGQWSGRVMIYINDVEQ